MDNDDKELNELLSKNSLTTIVGRPVSNNLSNKCNNDIPIDKPEGNLTQWTTPDNINYFASGESCSTLNPGVYNICSGNGQIWFEKLKFSSKNLIKFKGTVFEDVLQEIDKFWTRRHLFKNRENGFNIAFKRGFLFYGPPGSGKSVLLKLVIQDVIDRDGICIVFNSANNFIEGMKLLRMVQPTTKVVVIMEDFDEILDKNNGSEVLNVLDGVNSFEDIVFLATTNYPERLGARVINRPSRFDKRYKIGFPTEENRRIYLQSLISEKEMEEFKVDLNRWVEDTKDFSFAHLKELFTAVVLLDNKYEIAVEKIKSMREKVSSEKDELRDFGFNK